MPERRNRDDEPVEVQCHGPEVHADPDHRDVDRQCRPQGDVGPNSARRQKAEPHRRIVAGADQVQHQRHRGQAEGEVEHLSSKSCVFWSADATVTPDTGACSKLMSE